MRIIFMGTPEFSVPSLDILHKNGHEVVAVVTAEDKPAGRGRKIRKSAVKQYAEQEEIKVLQPGKLRDPEFIHALSELKPDLMVVVAFRMLPEMVWSIPSIGTFNLHASLLPDYRGAAPINWAIMNGEEKTGATTFFIDKKIDTGNLLLQREIDIPEDWTAGDLHDELMVKGAELVLETVEALEAGTIEAKAQDDSLFQNHAPKIFKEDCRIDWNREAYKVNNFIRGLSPYPTSWTKLGEKVLKIYKAEIAHLHGGNLPGSIHVQENKLFISCADGLLEIKELQLEGKKRMKTEDFLRGYKQEFEAVS
ncbi:MAG: methionyl-tRNA formyltransferase [Bacteroidia bacterium]|nr:methionyl-tRNA formyltransferase [Bacteroidia bacterium]